VTLRGGQVYTFRGERIVAVDNYHDPNDALEALGLSE
jgi:ketosteroid isomerase-like protein